MCIFYFHTFESVLDNGIHCNSEAENPVSMYVAYCNSRMSASRIVQRRERGRDDGQTDIESGCVVTGIEIIIFLSVGLLERTVNVHFSMLF